MDRPNGSPPPTSPGSGVLVRDATPADAAVLSDIERRCPVVLAETAVTVDRGEDYFAFARLMEDVTVVLGSVDGVPAAINCGAVHRVRVGGVAYRVMAAVHLRILPAYQRRGLWGAVSKRLIERYPLGAAIDAAEGLGPGAGTYGFVSIDNAAMQKGFATVPNRWGIRARCAHLASAALAGRPAGRAATRADAARIVEIVNACHGSEEMFHPYTVASLCARLERAPALYSWERLRVTEHAVVGVWPAGDTIAVTSASPAGTATSRRGRVLDYGFLPGAEDELEALLRAWCAWLAARGLDRLLVFTSAASPGHARLAGLAAEVEDFDLFTPGIPEPPGAAARGLYVDAVYF